MDLGTTATGEVWFGQEALDRGPLRGLDCAGKGACLVGWLGAEQLDPRQVGEIGLGAILRFHVQSLDFWFKQNRPGRVGSEGRSHSKRAGQVPGIVCFHFPVGKAM